MDISHIDLSKLDIWIESTIRKLLYDQVIYSDWSQKTYSLEDIELYIFHESVPDLFAHRSERQQQHGVWYFHQAPSSSDRSGEIPSQNKLRGGTRKGLDISLGNAAQGIHAGVLIRSIRKLMQLHNIMATADPIISGPCLVVHELLQITPSSSSEEYASKAHLAETSHSKLVLKEGRPGKDLDVHPALLVRGPRVNLTLNKQSPTLQDLRFAVAPLRFKFAHVNHERDVSATAEENIPSGQTTKSDTQTRVKPEKYVLSIIAQQLLDGRPEQLLKNYFSDQQINKAKTLLTLGRQFSLEVHLKNLKTMDDKKVTMAMGYLEKLDRV